VATESEHKLLIDATTPIETDSIEIAWQHLQTSEAFWAGYSGMLIGGLVYSILLSTFITIISYGVVGVVVMLGGVASCMGLIGVVGALVFVLVRYINASLGWPLSSRYAATAAAGMTGLVLFFIPLMAVGEGFEKGIPVGLVSWGPGVLMTFLQAGAWLGADREIRKFEQRIEFAASNKVVAQKKYRIDIKTLMICTFWLAGMMSMFGWFARLSNSPEGGIFILLAVFCTVFLSLGFSATLICVVKAVRGLQKKLFYRKPRIAN
jgi:hypothetical protein